MHVIAGACPVQENRMRTNKGKKKIIIKVNRKYKQNVDLIFVYKLYSYENKFRSNKAYVDIFLCNV